MKSNSITGLSFSLIPDDTIDQKTIAVVDPLAADIQTQHNNFYLFEGDMPASEVLQVYNDPVAFLAAYSSKLICKIEDFDLKYTYDKIKRIRKFQKWPVNAESFSSAVSGTAKWACMELNSVALSSTYKCLLFTDAVGGWDDANQSILVSNTTVVAGESITIKDINITIQDSLVSELI